jgi:TonB-linked SusC/RagA family outer membrane protein
MMQSNWKQALFSFAIFYSANLFSQTTTADSTAEGIDEVIVVGYSKSTKKELTGAVGSVKGADLVKQPVLTATQAIQGKLAGVQITNFGAPGSAPTVRIRGTGSVIGGAEPLYVVDGIITDDIRNIATSDILSVDVLKDASSTAIYGVRAANGVILITTKAGKRGTSSVSYDGFVGFKSLTNKVSMAGPNVFTDYSNEAAGTFAITQDQVTGKTDWMNEITRVGLQHNHSIAISGGGEKNASFFSVNYMKEEGILKGNDYERLTIRSNNDYYIGKKLKVGNTLNISNYKSNNKPFSVFTQAYNAAPLYDAITEPGVYGYTDVNNVGNPLATLDYTDDQSFGYRLMGNVFAEIKPAKGLTLTSSYGTDIYDNNGQNYQTRYRVNSTQRYDTTTLTVSNNTGYRWVWNNLAFYDKDINKDHKLKFLAGHTRERYDGEMYAISRDGVPSAPQYRYINTGTSTIQGNILYHRPVSDYGRRESFLAKVNYTFADKFFLTGSMRRDGSSKFPVQNRWGNFPALGLGWELTKESFLRKSANLSYLKLRASWGQVGNDRIEPAEFVTLLSTGLNAVFGNGDLQNGSTIAEIKDPNLKWEVTTEYDLGIDYELFRGRVTGTIDYYYKLTNGALFNVPLSAGLGDNNNSMLTNAADISNTGVEVTVGYRSKENKALKWNTNLTATFNRNRVENLGLGRPTNYGSLNNGEFATRVAAGQPIGVFWVYETDGIFQNKDEVNAAPHLFGTQPGDFKLVDKNGDGQITDLDRVYVGSHQPIVYLGWNSQFSWKNWDLNIDFFSNLGNKVFNGKKTVRYGGSYNVEYEVAQNRWTSQKPSNTVPRAYNGVPKPSDYYVESGSYLRLNNFSLGYTASEALKTKWGAKSVRFYITGQNLFTLKAYSGFTAELPGSPPEAGIELNIYPTSRTVLTGLQIQF